MAAIKAAHVSDVPNLDQVPESPSSLAAAVYATRFSKGLVDVERGTEEPKFVVIGHRGNGMNKLSSSTTEEISKSIKENTITSFHAAAKYPLDYIEFDVQVTKDLCPIIFHDNFILSQDSDGTVYEKRVTELCRSEFLSYGPQKEKEDKVGKPLLRKREDGKMVRWEVETDDCFCTLQEALEKVNPCVGFNIELKFDDNIVYQQYHLIRLLEPVLKVVSQHAKHRPIFFSSFQPDAALLVRKLQNTYPVFFLTNGGNETFYDVRRNSLEEAIKVCLEGGLQGIVSDVRGVFRNPGAVNKIKQAKLSLITYGRLNNEAEAVYMQHLMGVDGVIVDFVQEITEAVSNMMKKPGVQKNYDDDDDDEEEQQQQDVASKTHDLSSFRN